MRSKGHTLPLLCLPPADHPRSARKLHRLTHPSRGDRASRDQPSAPMASRPRRYLPVDTASRSVSAAPAHRAGEIGKSWTELPAARQRAFLTTLIDRIDVGADQIDIHVRPTRLSGLLDVAA